MSVVIALVLLTGQATWYGTGPGAGHAAAGPELRNALGPDWRGTRLEVCHAGRCVMVTVDDWCACGDKLIDLSDEDFTELAPLSAGIVRVTIGPLRVTATPPPTDVAVRSVARAGLIAL